MQLDGTTGQFKGDFDVRVEGSLADGCLVFGFRSTDLDAPIWAKGARPLKDADDWDKSTGMSQHKIAERGRLTVDDADCFVALADLVDNKHKERYPESADWPPYLLAGPDDGMRMIRHKDGQYCLRDDGTCYGSRSAWGRSLGYMAIKSVMSMEMWSGSPSRNGLPLPALLCSRAGLSRSSRMGAMRFLFLTIFISPKRLHPKPTEASFRCGRVLI